MQRDKLDASVYLNRYQIDTSSFSHRVVLCCIDQLYICKQINDDGIKFLVVDILMLTATDSTMY
jgi:hypothetical protein